MVREKTLDFDPEFADAHFDLGQLLLELGDTPGTEAHYGLGACLRAQGQDVEALKAFQDALNRDPQHEQARTALDRLRPQPQ